MNTGSPEQIANKLYWVRDNVLADAFPAAERALDDPEGLLAIGGDLSAARLLAAYRAGIFPWFSEGQPVLWWSPDPRCVLPPDQIRISRSLAKRLRNGHFEVTFNTAFGAVMDGCAAPRKDSASTWITKSMRTAYLRLFQQGYAHSVECWRDGRLAGGLYGVALGRVFFGESMFSRRPDASKVALATLADRLQARHFRLIDCQVDSAHMRRLGAKPIDRARFLRLLAAHCSMQKTANWDTA